MNRLVFISVVIGIWGMALFWITMDPPKTSSPLDQPVELAAIDEDESCGLVARIQYEVNKFSDEMGFAHLVPDAISSDLESCSDVTEADSEEENDPRANQIRGGFQRRKVLVSTFDAYIPEADVSCWDCLSIDV